MPKSSTPALLLITVSPWSPVPSGRRNHVSGSAAQPEAAIILSRPRGCADLRLSALASTVFTTIYQLKMALTHLMLLTPRNKPSGFHNRIVAEGGKALRCATTRPKALANVVLIRRFPDLVRQKEQRRSKRLQLLLRGVSRRGQTFFGVIHRGHRNAISCAFKRARGPAFPTEVVGFQ